ncbi:unnamed protein product [Closterium sp. NIES-65]|nr:unnamed protein product [Closterium sp. NIES-65]
MAPLALAAGTAHRRRKWPEARPLVAGRVTRKALVLIKELKTKPPANEDELHQRLENIYICVASPSPIPPAFPHPSCLPPSPLPFPIALPSPISPAFPYPPCLSPSPLLSPIPPAFPHPPCLPPSPLPFPIPRAFPHPPCLPPSPLPSPIPPAFPHPPCFPPSPLPSPIPPAFPHPLCLSPSPVPFPIPPAFPHPPCRPSCACLRLWPTHPIRSAGWVKGVRPHRRDLIDTIKEMDTADTRELLCQVMQWSLSEEWYEADARDYTKLVERFGKDGRLGEMERAFTGMEADGIAPDLISFSVKINAYGRAKEVEKAKAAWEEMRLRGITPDAKAYTTMMTVYGKAGQPDKAEQLLDAMLAAACKPSPVTLCSLVTAYGLAGRPDDAQRVFDKVLQTTTVCGKAGQPYKAYTTMMTVYGKAGQPGKAEQLLDAMLAAACKPSPVTLCSLVMAYGLAGRPDDAQRVFDKLLAQTDIKPDCHVFTALSAAFGLNGRTDEAVAAFKRMLAAGLAPDDRSVARLVEAHGSMDRQLDRQLALLAGGVEGGAEGGAAGGEEGGEEGGEGRRGEEGVGVGRREASEEEKLRQAVRLVLELERAGIRPGVETYTALISLFASHGLVNLVLQLEGAGIRTGMEIYTAFISLSPSRITTASIQNLLREAAEVFEEMQRVGLQPNARTYTRLFQAYALAGDLDSCSQVRKTMQVLGWTLNPPIVRGMVRALVAGGQGGAAAELVREAEEEEGVAVDGDVKEMAQSHAREMVH